MRAQVCGKVIDTGPLVKFGRRQALEREGEDLKIQKRPFRWVHRLSWLILCFQYHILLLLLCMGKPMVLKSTLVMLAACSTCLLLLFWGYNMLIDRIAGRAEGLVMNTNISTCLMNKAFIICCCPMSYVVVVVRAVGYWLTYGSVMWLWCDWEPSPQEWDSDQPTVMPCVGATHYLTEGCSGLRETHFIWGEVSNGDEGSRLASTTATTSGGMRSTGQQLSNRQYLAHVYHQSNTHC